MFEIDGVSYTFHHLGIPTEQARTGERFSDLFRMYTSDAACNTIRVQWHRFEHDSPLDPLIKGVPHVALQVSNLERAIAGRRLLLGPYEPIANYRVAIVDDGGVPLELVETSLSHDELWARAETSRIYGRGADPK